MRFQSTITSTIGEFDNIEMDVRNDLPIDGSSLFDTSLKFPCNG